MQSLRSMPGSTPRFALLALLSLLIVAGAAHAGTVYVAVAADGPVGEVSYETILVVTNPTDELRFVSLDFHPGIVDGVLLQGDPEPHLHGLPAGQTRLFTGLTRGLGPGMVEVTGDDLLAVDARLRVTGRSGTSEFIQIPVVSSDDLLADGRLHVLPGWYRTDTLRTSFGLLNLSESQNECTLDLRELLGGDLMQTAVLTLPPVTMVFASDAIGLVGLSTLAEGRLEISCTAPFYTYGLVTDVETGMVTRREVADDLASALGTDFADDTSDPGDPGDDPSGGGSGGSGGDPSRGVIVETEPGLVRLRVPGLVHAPRRGNDKWIYRLDLPSLGVIDSINATVVVRPGQWGNMRARPQHHLLQISNARWGDGGWDFWVRPDGNPGFVMKGLLATQGRGAGNAVERGTMSSLPASYRVTVNQNGRTLSAEGLRINRGILTPRTGPLFIQLGADLGAGHDPKVPSYGWTWHDLVIEIRGR